jgi:hypothetical protein
MKSLIVAASALLLASSAAAQRDPAFYLHLNGLSYHLNRRDLNERNWGVGFTYEFNPADRWVWSADGDFFRDSFDDPSGYLGGALRHRWDWFDAGLLGFVMYRETAGNAIGTKVFPGVLPFIEFGTARVRIRSAYIPRVTGREDEAITFQLLIRF